MPPRARNMSPSVYSGDYEALRKAKGQSRLLLIALVVSILLFATFLWNTSGSAEEFSVRKAVAVLKGPTVEGTVYFSQSSSKGPVSISGSLKNVSPNTDRGFHIHELGDATDGCMSSGSHFNPEGKTHGAPQDSNRHVGDLGNVRSDATGIITLGISDSQISLNGPFSIIGRTVVIHEGTDDFGRGKNEESLRTGNAGGRAGCAVIGIAAD
ncbi:superoxide dismutase [Gautieria morchelliformis]|nr:superoxide dismutase [Gautieria morchelliformis]